MFYLLLLLRQTTLLSKMFLHKTGVLSGHTKGSASELNILWALDIIITVNSNPVVSLFNLAQLVDLMIAFNGLSYLSLSSKTERILSIVSVVFSVISSISGKSRNGVSSESETNTKQ